MYRGTLLGLHWEANSSESVFLIHWDGQGKMLSKRTTANERVALQS